MESGPFISRWMWGRPSASWNSLDQNPTGRSPNARYQASPNARR